ncbi:MAG: sigma-70 family RNA polymerase sigma factor [Ruminococcaceae bacterium]|nr:sigma-70 family RNA polymerase sigma factor [Oscillospiraceae bacterium]
MQAVDKKKVPLSDESIIKMYFDRDEKAISETDSKYGRYLKTIGYNILHDTWDSEECANDTYYSTWNRIPPEKPSIFQAFLSKIMRDISISKYRKKSASRRVPSELIVSLEELGDCIVADASVEEDYAIKQITEVLNSFLAEIGKRERFVFISRYYYCDRVKYIAEMLGVSEKTVYRDLERLRGRLRGKLSKEGIEV